MSRWSSTIAVSAYAVFCVGLAYFGPDGVGKVTTVSLGGMLVFSTFCMESLGNIIIDRDE